jgi:hypothetical protein
MGTMSLGTDSVSSRNSTAPRPNTLTEANVRSNVPSTIDRRLSRSWSTSAHVSAPAAGLTDLRPRF